MYCGVVVAMTASWAVWAMIPWAAGRATTHCLGDDADVFIFTSGEGNDVIYDFEEGTDMIQLSDLNYTVDYGPWGTTINYADATSIQIWDNTGIWASQAEAEAFVADHVFFA